MVYRARTAILLLCLTLLAACVTNPRDIRLAEVDLRDMGTVSQIRARLDDREAVAFADYVVRHSASSDSFCGKLLLGPDGRQPATIGEAIDLTLLRAAEESRAAAEANRPKEAWEIAQEKWDDLIARRDVFLDDQMLVRAEYGEEAAQQPEFQNSKAKIAEIEKLLVELKPEVFGAVD